MINRSNGQKNIENHGVNNGVIVSENNGIINLNYKEVIKIPTLLSSIVKALGLACIEDVEENENSMIAFKPDDKLEYNQVIKYKDIIKEYSVYYSSCDYRLNIYDDSNCGSKKKILKCIKGWYQEEKGQVLLDLKDSKLTDIEKIREKADYIIEAVRCKIIDAVLRSTGDMNASFEELEIGASCFTCYCFMECKILEKPE